MDNSTDFFDNLATYVDREWKTTAFEPAAFAEIATQGLKNFKYNWTPHELEQFLETWFERTPQLPDQINVHNTFGQPPITIFNNQRFVVELYFWLGCDTSIHSHGFRGAFKVLHGKSLHETYTATLQKRIANDVAFVELGHPNLEILEQGDIRTILPGESLTHRVIHLEAPTVTLCVKTIGETALSQWHHFQNGLAIQKRHLDAGLIKQVYFFQYLTSQNGELANAFVKRLLDRTDISTLMNLCEELSGSGYDLTDDIRQFILDNVYDRYKDSEWFSLYEAAGLIAEEEISFDTSASAVARLAAHFTNSQMTLTQTRAHLDAVARKTLSTTEIEDSLLSLVNPEHPHAELQSNRARTYLDS